MNPSAGLQQLTAEIYEAAFEPSLWSRFLDSLCQATDSACIVITTSSLDCTGHSQPLLHNLPDTAWAFYQQELMATCPRQRFILNTKPGSVFTDRYSDKPLSREDDLYYEALERHWGVRHFLTSLLPISDHALTHISLFRSSQQGSFESPDIQLLEYLSPHLMRGLNLHNDRVLRNCLASSGAGAFPVIANAVLLDSTATPIYQSKTNNGALLVGNALKIDAGRLSTRYPSDQAKLDNLILSAIQPGKTHDPSNTSVMSLPGESGMRPIKVQFHSIKRIDQFDPLLDVKAAVLIIDPNRTVLPNISYLKQLYKLTSSEARFANALIEHGSLAEASTNLGISKNTARAHLQSVFRKTNTTSQIALIKLILSN